MGARVSKTVEGVTTQYVHDAFGNVAAEYSTAGPQDVQCKTCYLSWDQLGSTRLVTDSSANVIARHDFLPFGQEIPGGDAGRTSQWDADDSVNQKFTGQDHDVETALDFFQARYHANQQGRFMSADPDQAGADITNPQSWNGYGYVLGNPLANVDQSGRSCITLDDGSQGDDGDGLGCAGAGVAPGSAGDPSTLNQGQTNAQVNAQNPSELEYLWTISTNQMPIYVSNDVPLSPNAQKVITQVGRILPTTCGGGAYFYAGKEQGGEGVKGFAGTIVEVDSRSGMSKGALFEMSAGQGAQGGVGYFATTNASGQTESSPLAFVGAGADTPAAGGSIGLVGFPSGAGVYAEGSVFGRTAGVGAYVNILPNAGCHSGGY